MSFVINKEVEIIIIPKSLRYKKIFAKIPSGMPKDYIPMVNYKLKLSLCYLSYLSYLTMQSLKNLLTLTPLLKTKPSL